MSVEIIGRAVRAPGAESPEELFDLLKQRRCMITKIPADRWDQSRYWHPEIGVRGKTYTFAAGVIDDCFSFDAGVFGLSQREAQLMDPQQRMILQLAWRALESANLDYTDLRGQRVGVYVGSSSLDNANLVIEDTAAAGPHFMTGNTLSIVSNRISHVFGLSGPSLTVDTACSSSLVALDLAVKALEAGDVDTAIVGGVHVLTHPLAFVGFAQARMLSPEGLCRAYDNDGIGYVRAEGGSVVILRRTDVAASQGDRSYARIIASAVNSAGRTNGISLPSEKAQAHLLRSLYQGNGIDPNSLAFIEGHGTGTKVGDPAEIWSIGTVIGAARRAPIPIGSIKTNIGHTEPASGLMGLMKAMLALEHNYFPASLHFETPNDSIDFGALNVHVAAEPIELLHGKQARLAGVNSFGFGGTNAHVIISDPANRTERDKPDASIGKTFIATAHTATALDSLLKDYRSALKEASPTARRSLIAAAGANRRHMKHRFVVTADDPDAIVKAIDARIRDRDAKEAVQAEAVHDQSKIAYVFSGNGSQWAGMAVDAYRRNTAFRDRFNVIHALFQVRTQISLIDLLFDPELDAKLRDTKIAQPLLFAIQAALADVLALLGVKPDAVFGHSVGEVAAAYVSGAISLVDAVSVVAKRSYHQDRLAGLGKMAALQLSPTDAVAFFTKHNLDELTVAAVNAKGSVTVSGPAEQILTLKEVMKAERVVGQVLDINYPFHHPLIEIAKDDFLDDMSQIALRPSQVPFISTVTGEVLSGESLDPSYWWSNVREPVAFFQATNTALDLGCTLFVEIGPRPILTSYLKDTVKDRSIAATAVPSLLREENAADPVSTTFARVIANGGAFDRRKVFGARNARIELPALPFEPVDMRHEFTSEALDLYGRQNAPTTLAGWRIDPSSGSWRSHIDAHLFPDLAEHVVDRKSILPGSAFLDIALSASLEFLGTEQVEISNLDIFRPLELSDQHLREIATTISADTGDIEIKSRDRLSNDDWTIHAIARCRKLPAGASAPIPSVETKSKKSPIAGSVAYETARQFGLDYGPTFQLLKEARRVGEHQIDVSIAEPLAAQNPYVEYNLHPVSVDAVFHGLVALYADISGQSRGAPYIPVRFGVARLFRAHATIANARIDIRRVSSGSIKADFTFFDKSGEVVAAFEDCRFKRTYLRQQKPLSDVSYHQTLVPSAISFASADDKLPAKPVFFPMVEEDGDGSTQMLEAAIYRASYEISRKAGRGTGVVSAALLPGDLDLKRFLANCLLLLEEVDLAKQGDGRWTLASECTLPPVEAILNAVYRERPDRIAEITAVNDVWREALDRLEAIHTSDDPSNVETASAKPHFISDTIAESLHVHAPASVARVKMTESALRDAVASRSETRPVRRIVELGSVSRLVTARFAEIAAKAGAVLIVVETNDSAFSELTIAFETNPYVSVVRPPELKQVGPVDLVVSAAEHAFAIANADGIADTIGSSLAPGALFVIGAPAPSAFADFANGLNEGWFDRGKSVEFPLGQIASVEDWEALLRFLSATDVKVVRHALVDGPIISVEAAAKQAEQRTAPASAVPLFVIADGKKPAKGVVDFAAIRLGDGGDKDREALTRALARLSADSIEVAYVPEAVHGDGSEWLRATVMRVALIAGALQAEDAGGDEASAAKRLAVVIDAEPRSGKAASGELNAFAAREGLHTFLRVLRNEYETIDLHSVTLTGPRADISDDLDRVASLVASGSANREWRIERASGDVTEIRAAPGPVDRIVSGTTDFKAATVRQATASQVTSLGWHTTVPGEPGPNEVRIAVTAAGLNFRDVMWAMGMLPEEALEDGFAGPTIGMECAGHIQALGSNVRDLSIGDPVMAVAPAAFSTHVCVKRAGVAKLPEGIDMVAGATLPVAFLTAYYSIVELARLRPGETILIHGGAGGVGLAALQIAKACGAKVITTAGSIEKRRLLETLGADHVFNSRTLSFVDDVNRVTDGQGVDVVLNSLFSEAMERSISLLKPFGRFLELGKRDFYGDTKIGLRPFRRNISYFGIDADQLLNTLPELSGKLLGDISAMFEKGELSPLPYRAFHPDEIVSAFRLMQGSGHIGKIVVKIPVPGVDTVQIAPRANTRVDAEGVHLVLGGIGGFGLATAGWLVERGARNIALCSRRGVPDEDTAAAIRKWNAQGVSTSVFACDITDEAAVAEMLRALRLEGPLKTVVHAAMVLDDGLIENLTDDRVRVVVDPKAKAAAIFDRLTREDDLDELILFSSATTLVGNPGQGNYVAANGYLEGLARARRRQGLPALAVGFGAISDTGFLARNTEVNEILAKRIGKTGMTARQALDYVEDYIAVDPGTVEAASVAIAELDMAMARHLKTVASPLFEIVTRSSSSQSSGGEGDQIDLAALVAGKSAEEGEQLIFQLVATEIAAILRIPVADISPLKVIKDVGLDSLMAMELGMSFRQKTGFEMPLSSVTQSTTVGDVSRKLYLKVTQHSDTEGGEEAPADIAIVDKLASRHTTGAVAAQ